MNLTIVTGGEGSARVSNNNALSGTANGSNANDPCTSQYAGGVQIPSRSARPYKSYPKVRDFLQKLDEEFDRDFYRFTRILTDEDYLGYSRICDIITTYGAIQRPNVSGGEWLKDRIERMAATANEESVMGLRISEGSSNIIFQQMLTVFEEIDSA